jgi:hypothetical protein
MPEKSYFIRELERKIGEDAKNISRELLNLEKIGFVKNEKRGNQKFYAVREDFLFYPELKALFLKSSGLMRPFKDVLTKISGVERAFLKEIPYLEAGSSGLIKLVIIGNPDMTVLNETINTLIDKIGREIIYRCYDNEEFEERRRMEDAFIIEAVSGKKIF